VNEAAQAVDSNANQLRIRFVEQIASGDVPSADALLMSFKDPAPCYAVAVAAAAGETAADTAGDILDITLLPQSTMPPEHWPDAAGTPNDPPPVFIKYRGVELTFRPGRATLQCDPEQTDSFLPGLIEFAHYERELRRIEDEIAAGWPDLDQDRGLAFEVTPTSLKRSDVVGARMDRVLQRRMRLARIEPHLNEPASSLPAAARKLGAELREKAHLEARLETVDGQLEVFEYIYELGSQRMGEYRAAREEHTLEWIIIVLLAVESLAMLAQMFIRFRG
jgi:hypothetical protein